MTAQEIHIGLDIQLQKINTNSTRNILPEEKDWLFNEQVTRFINGVVREQSNFKQKGFQEDIKRLKDIQPLVCKKDILIEHINDKEGKFILPPYCFSPIRTDVAFFKKCEASKYTKTTKTENLFIIKFPEGDTEHKIDIVLNGETQTIFDTERLPSNYIKGVYFNLLRAFEIKIRNLFREDKYKGLELYFENYGDLYLENTFFIKGSTSLSDIKFIGSTSRLKIIKKELKYPIHTSEKEIVNTARLSNEEKEMYKIKSYLSPSLQESPLYSIQRYFGEVYYPKNTIAKKVSFHYICKPQLIDVYLGQGLNLDRAICEEIIVHTARFIKALIDSNNYEKYINETNLIE